MTIFLLRLEGVNLASVFEDTDQVSVIRGASFRLRELARNLPDLVEKDWNLGVHLEYVSFGASVGLYTCEYEDGAGLARKIDEKLRADDNYRHFTFVVDACEYKPRASDDPEEFCKRLEELVAANRRRQMRMPSLSLAGLASAKEPCAWNGIRPADGEPVEREGKSLLMSASVYSRYSSGRDLRQTFYEEEAGKEFAGLKFTDDLEELALDDSRGNLNGKLALIYLDGNRFGALQRTHCTLLEKQKEFDKYVRDERQSYLAEFLRRVTKDERYRTTDKKTGEEKLRLEVLMWGGDEILLVVPAWCGLDALGFFFEHSENWKFDDQPLTHAGGIVFAQYKTPLHRLTRLAKEGLAEGVKNALPKGETCNGFDYVVLESIDYPTESLEKFRQRVFGAELAESRQPLAPIHPQVLGEAAKIAELPKGQCYAIARAILGEKAGGDDLDKAVERLKAVAGEASVEQARAAMGALYQPMLPRSGNPARPENEISDAWRWLHAVELWDYLPAGQEGEKQ